MTRSPRWERRVRAPQLIAFSLLGSPVSWADDVSHAGVLLANPSGRTEVFAFDASQVPARLTQITDRPQGTMGAAVSPDGRDVFWFDDHAGDEVGRWMRAGVDASQGVQAPLASVPVLPHLDPSYPGGIEVLPDGRVVVGRLMDAALAEGMGFELAVADADGGGEVVFRCADPAFLADVSHDARRALLAVAPDGNSLRLKAVVLDLAAGAVVAELVDEGRNLSPVQFHPADSSLVLFAHERHDFITSAVWDVDSGRQDDVVTNFDGDVTALWYPDGKSLLLSVLHDARHQLYCYDRPTAECTPVELPRGTVSVASARPDGSVHALFSASDRPVSLLRSAGSTVTNLVQLPDPTPPPSVPATDVHVAGPGGTVHALVHEPPARSRPHATVFMPHGGPTALDLDAWNNMVAAWLDAGYAVVRVNYRGSTGYGAAWRDALRVRLGFIELEDITAVREHLETTGVIDAERVSIVGGSWGGFLTLMAVGTQPERWRSGVALVPLADQFTSAEDAPSFMRAYDAVLMGGTIEEVPDVYRAASPITYADAVVAPLFVTAGENDPRCPVRQVDTYVERLRSRGHEVEYVRMATGHALPDLDLLVAELGQVLDFLARTLPVDSAEDEASAPTLQA
jgi:dipeptidyl aminopeptidase/acylaminoacyl peptidase